MSIHINWTKTHERSIRWFTCPDCKRLAPAACFFQEWYGWDQTCLRCGRRWSDSEWMPLNFERGARAKSIAAAKARWRRGLTKGTP